MPLHFNTGGFAVVDRPVITTVCLDAVFQVNIGLCAIWDNCNE